MKNHFLTLIILLTGFIQAQELPESLTLKESIAYGLTNNRSIINADREIQKSKKERWKTIASGLPQISTEVNYQNFLEMPFRLSQQNFLAVTLGNFQS